MKRAVTALHQWVVGPLTGAYGWAYLLELRDTARHAGLVAELYTDEPPEQWKAQVRPLTDCALGGADELLLVHGQPQAEHERHLARCDGHVLLLPGPEAEPAALSELIRRRPMIRGLLSREPQLLEGLYARDVTIPVSRIDYPSWQLPPVPPPADLDRPRPFTVLVHVAELQHEEAVKGLLQLAHPSGASWRLCVYGDEQPLHRADFLAGVAALDHIELTVLRAEEPLPAVDLAFSLEPAPDPAWLLRLLALGIPLVGNAQSSEGREILGNGYWPLAATAPAHTADVLQRLMDNPGLRYEVQHRGDAQARRWTAEGFYQWLLTWMAVHNVVLPPPFRSAVDIRVEGPFDSSYSLAVVNRELARGFAAVGASVALRATEGPGPIPVSPEFLAADPASAAAHARAEEPAAAVLRLLYPPRVSDMAGEVRVLSCYGWEESLLPVEAVAGFNRYLQLVTSMSSYVTRVLEDNGVDVPVVTVGLGADHILRTPAEPALLGRALPGSATTLKLLHISSCFPRKGVDVLLDAYSRAFTAADDVVLVIKTFPNPHHDIDAELAAWRARHSAAPAVELFNLDLPEAAIRALYVWADVLVAPSRGEGFGLPLAEAMLHECAVVTTGYGGQTDFCMPETSWLIDYRFTRAQTHMQLSGSLWAEPDTDHLARLLAHFAAARREGRWQALVRSRLLRADRLIRRDYTWEQVARRTQAAIARVRALPPCKPQPRVGTVTTWNSACGIAGYSQQLIAGPLAATQVFANRHVALINPEGQEIQRVWDQGGQDSLDDLLQALDRQPVDILLIQFNFGFFGLVPFARFLHEVHRRGIRTLVTFHSTADLDRPGDHRSLRQLRLALRQSSRLLVHSSHDLNRLKDFGLADNLMLFPHGVMPPPRALELPDEAQALAGRRIVASYGFLLPPKGILQLIEAFAEVAAADDDLYLLLVNAQYPVPESAALAEECRQRIMALGLEGRAQLIDRFLDDRESLAWLSLAEVVVFPYQHTQESSSAAVRWGLLAGKPVLCTPLDIFEDVDEAVYRLPGTDAQAIAAGLREHLAAGRPSRQGEWLRSHAWPAISTRIDGLFRALAQQAVGDHSKAQELS
ncbi:glycosyltransferase involved in cell wall biosynthesis [Pseudomonas sp. SORGH_AS 211]|nr:glycosyltransferase involved in cell wall biosynthesis [Pseudomonas sp. SORGH_AS_0211]